MGTRSSLLRTREAKAFPILYGHWLDQETTSTKTTSDELRLILQDITENRTPEDSYLEEMDSEDMMDTKDTNNIWFERPVTYILLGVLMVSLLGIIAMTVFFSISIVRP